VRGHILFHSKIKIQKTKHKLQIDKKKLKNIHNEQQQQQQKENCFARG
jgi:hypothetical protein